MQLGRPLIPLDNTTANLIAHQLIGEPYANSLDQAIFETVDGLLDPARMTSEERQTCRACLEDEETRQAWQQWPCLSRQLGMELRWAVSDHQSASCAPGGAKRWQSSPRSSRRFRPRRLQATWKRRASRSANGPSPRMRRPKRLS